MPLWPIVPEQTTHHVTVRFELDPNLTTQLLTLLRGSFQKLRDIETNVETLMALTQETRDVLARLDTATNAVAAKVQAAIEKIKELGLDAEDEAEIVGRLTPVVSTLEGLAADPQTPVP